MCYFVVEQSIFFISTHYLGMVRGSFPAPGSVSVARQRLAHRSIEIDGRFPNVAGSCHHHPPPFFVGVRHFAGFGTRYIGKRSSGNGSRRVRVANHPVGTLHQEETKVSFVCSSRFSLFVFFFSVPLTRPDPYNHPLAVLS
jgi:hypothetical protein